MRAPGRQPECQPPVGARLVRLSYRGGMARGRKAVGWASALLAITGVVIALFAIYFAERSAFIERRASCLDAALLLADAAHGLQAPPGFDRPPEFSEAAAAGLLSQLRDVELLCVVSGLVNEDQPDIVAAGAISRELSTATPDVGFIPVDLVTTDDLVVELRRSTLALRDHIVALDVWATLT